MKRASFVALLMVLSGYESSAQVGGVSVDADGVLRQLPRVQLIDRDRLNSGRQGHPRIVSLTEIARRLSRTITNPDRLYADWSAELRRVGGLVRVEGILLTRDPDQILLVGQGDEPDENNSGRGRSTGRPFLSLDDLLRAWCYAFDDDAPDGFVGCSIDPTETGVRRYRSALSRWRRRLAGTSAASVVKALERAIGPQQVSIFGVPDDSRFGLKLVVADYRLKRLAMGHDPAPSEQLPSYLDLLASQDETGPVHQHRWWFEPSYDSIEHDRQQQFFMLRGPSVGVKVDRIRAEATGPGSPEQASAARQVLSGSPGAARDYADRVSAQFDFLARYDPVFAELQNLVDLCMVCELAAARIHDDGEERWRLDVLSDPRLIACLPRGNPPRTIRAIAGIRRVSKKKVLVSFSGGVEIDARAFASRKNWRIVQSPVVLDRFARLQKTLENRKSVDRLIYEVMDPSADSHQ